jgi:hypothetical protein
MRGRKSRCTRADVAWDFQCDADLTAEDLLRLLGWGGGSEFRERVVQRRGKVGFETYYVGGQSSDRRVRIYRKDLEEPSWIFGPTLRVEGILTGDVAAAWWHVWCEDKARGYGVMAGHLAELLGVRVQEELAELPELVEPEGAELAGSLFACLEQYGGLLAVCRQGRVNVLELAEEHQAAAPGNRMAKSRAKRRLQEITETGARLVEDLVREMIRIRRGGASLAAAAEAAGPESARR